MHICNTKPGTHSPCHYRGALLIATLLVMIAFCSGASAQEVSQKQFKSPEDAFSSLTKAVKENDTKELLAIFGPEGKELISSGDAVADKNARERFIRSAAEAVTFAKINDTTVLPAIGKQVCSFPIPLVKSGQGWVFATEEGKQEILNRRIGGNELNTIRVAHAYVDAQLEYASRDRTGCGILQYAQHFLSHKEMKDGLYWEVKKGQEMSPLGPLIARAAEEGYPIEKGQKHRPYHGYYFKILKGQGRNAPGGELDYVVSGRMIAGFGLVAYPAEYGVSGIMTFVVNQLGSVYQKDLGPKTSELAKAMTRYDPDATWKKAD
jgi:hypothetical protein